MLTKHCIWNWSFYLLFSLPSIIQLINDETDIQPMKRLNLWIPLRIHLTGAREMSQRLRALAALPEVLSSIFSNHMVVHNPL